MCARPCRREAVGTRVSRREFLHVDDMAAASVFVMQLSDEQYAQACGGGEVSHLNVGCGKDNTIRELAEIVRKAVGFEGTSSGTRPGLTACPEAARRVAPDRTRLERAN